MLQHLSMDKRVAWNSRRFILFFFLKWNMVSIFQYAAIEKYLQKYVFREKLFWSKAFLKPRQKSLVDEVQFF